MSPALHHRRRGAVGAISAGALNMVRTESIVVAGLPRVPELSIDRPRLLARLNEWAPVTLLEGLRGTGKTTLAAWWLADQSPFEVTSLWLGGGTGIADEVELELGLVLDCAGIGRGSASAIARLHNALTACPSGHKLVLVLDGITSGIDDDTGRSLIALTQRHRNFHLVACLGTGDQLAALAAASGSVNTVTTRELLFDRVEVAELASLYPFCANDRRVASLHATTGGWPAILRLALAACANETALPREAISRYVLGAVGELDELAQFALADFVDPAMIEAIGGVDATPGIIERMQRSGLVETTKLGDATGYVFPTIVRDVLRAAYVDRDPDAARTLHGQFASWFAVGEGDEHALAAMRHAIAARNWELVGQVWDRRGVTLALATPIGCARCCATSRRTCATFDRRSRRQRRHSRHPAWTPRRVRSRAAWVSSHYGSQMTSWPPSPCRTSSI